MKVSIWTCICLLLMTPWMPRFVRFVLASPATTSPTAKSRGHEHQAEEPDSTTDESVPLPTCGLHPDGGNGGRDSGWPGTEQFFVLQRELLSCLRDRKCVKRLYDQARLISAKFSSATSSPKPFMKLLTLFSMKGNFSYEAFAELVSYALNATSIVKDLSFAELDNIASVKPDPRA